MFPAENGVALNWALTVQNLLHDVLGMQRTAEALPVLVVMGVLLLKVDSD